MEINGFIRLKNRNLRVALRQKYGYISSINKSTNFAIKGIVI